jgi:hypothetical protein
VVELEVGRDHVVLNRSRVKREFGLADPPRCRGRRALGGFDGGVGALSGAGRARQRGPATLANCIEVG